MAESQADYIVAGPGDLPEIGPEAGNIDQVIQPFPIALLGLRRGASQPGPDRLVAAEMAG